MDEINFKYKIMENLELDVTAFIIEKRYRCDPDHRDDASAMIDSVADNVSRFILDIDGIFIQEAIPESAFLEIAPPRPLRDVLKDKALQIYRRSPIAELSHGHQ